MKRSGVYQIRCKVNGKVYVGVSKDIHRRWMNHRTELGKGVSPHAKLQADWSRFGQDAFVFEVLELVAEPEQFRQVEYDWITKLSSFKPLLGYNAKVDFGGITGSTMLLCKRQAKADAIASL